MGIVSFGKYFAEFYGVVDPICYDIDHNDTDSQNKNKFVPINSNILKFALDNEHL